MNRVLPCAKITIISLVWTATLFITYFVAVERVKEENEHYFSYFTPIRNSVPGLEHVSPILGINAPSAISLGMMEDLKEQIEDTAKEYKKSGSLLAYGLYFRDLNSSLWLGVNEDASFVPASLFKLPVALVIYKQIEDGLLSKESRLTYTKEFEGAARSHSFASPSKLKVGSSYTVRELLELMIVESDNGAKDLLGSVVKDPYVESLFNIVKLTDQTNTSVITVSNYAFFFRLLYSATYLSEKSSEELLELLAASTYSGGLVKGVSSNVTVAHKFGRYNFGNSSPQGELHDCGIVYHPERPYLLCVMTRGSDLKKLESFIQSISALVYNDVSSPR